MAGKNTMEPIDDAQLEFIAGGLNGVLPTCYKHEWVFTGMHTDATQNITWNYYKCSKCGAEKTVRS